MQVKPLPTGKSVIPVYRARAGHCFLIEGVREVVHPVFGPVNTAPLKPGIPLNLLGLAATPGAMASGMIEETDEINLNAFGVQALYFMVNDVLAKAELTWDRFTFLPIEPGAVRQLHFNGRVDFTTDVGMVGSVVLSATVDVQTAAFQYDWQDLQGLPEGSFLAGLDLYMERVNYNRRSDWESASAAA